MIRFLSHLYDLSGELEEQQGKEKEAEKELRTLSEGFGVQQRLLRTMLQRKKAQDFIIQKLRRRFIEKQKSILESYGFSELDALLEDAQNEKEDRPNEPVDAKMDRSVEESTESGKNEAHSTGEEETSDPNQAAAAVSMNEPSASPQQAALHRSSLSTRELLAQLPSLESIRSSLHESEATAAIKFAEYQSACQALQEFHSKMDSVADEISLLKRQLFASKQSKSDETTEVSKPNRSNVASFVRIDREVDRTGAEPPGNALRGIAEQRGGDPGDHHAVLCLGRFIADDAAKAGFLRGADGRRGAFRWVQ